MKTLVVDFGSRSYPIHVGRDLLDCTSLYLPHIKGNTLALVTNESVANIYLQRVKDALSSFVITEIVIPDGEQEKQLDTINNICGSLIESNHNRGTTLIALGGGVVGDITGFVASCYLRGVEFLQIPTTLLSQVDSSVGGKTGVNHSFGKNMIGAFHQPRCVISDVSTLNTLSDREFSSGLAEVIKYGLITDAEFYSWLKSNMEGLLSRNPNLLIEAIIRSCRNKANIVEQDEKEAGARALLNLGHTFGHAIEAIFGYGGILHGEAVSIGIIMASTLSLKMKWISSDDFQQIYDLVALAKLPVSLTKPLEMNKMLQFIKSDKKTLDTGIRLVLLKKIGHAIVTSEFSEEMLKETLDEFCGVSVEEPA